MTTLLAERPRGLVGSRPELYHRWPLVPRGAIEIDPDDDLPSKWNSAQAGDTVVLNGTNVSHSIGSTLELKSGVRYMTRTLPTIGGVRTKGGGTMNAWVKEGSTTKADVWRVQDTSPGTGWVKVGTVNCPVTVRGNGSVQLGMDGGKTAQCEIWGIHFTNFPGPQTSQGVSQIGTGVTGMNNGKMYYCKISETDNHGGGGNVGNTELWFCEFTRNGLDHDWGGTSAGGFKQGSGRLTARFCYCFDNYANGLWADHTSTGDFQHCIAVLNVKAGLKLETGQSDYPRFGNNKMMRNLCSANNKEGHPQGGGLSNTNVPDDEIAYNVFGNWFGYDTDLDGGQPGIRVAGGGGRGPACTNCDVVIHDNQMNGDTVSGCGGVVTCNNN